MLCYDLAPVAFASTMLLSSILAVISFATSALAVVGPGVVTGNTAVHDPTMCKDNTGKYFVFCKFPLSLFIPSSSWILLACCSISLELSATGVGIEIRTSPDRTAWTLVGTVWATNQATWTNAYTGTSNGYAHHWVFSNR